MQKWHFWLNLLVWHGQVVLVSTEFNGCLPYQQLATFMPKWKPTFWGMPPPDKSSWEVIIQTTDLYFELISLGPWGNLVGDHGDMSLPLFYLVSTIPIHNQRNGENWESKTRQSYNVCPLLIYCFVSWDSQTIPCSTGLNHKETPALVKFCFYVDWRRNIYYYFISHADQNKQIWNCLEV